jgi:hypothetical protein
MLPGAARIPSARAFFLSRHPQVSSDPLFYLLTAVAVILLGLSKGGLVGLGGGFETRPYKDRHRCATFWHAGRPD